MEILIECLTDWLYAKKQFNLREYNIAYDVFPKHIQMSSILRVASMLYSVDVRSLSDIKRDVGLNFYHLHHHFDIEKVNFFDRRGQEAYALYLDYRTTDNFVMAFYFIRNRVIILSPLPVDALQELHDVPPF